MFRTRLPALLLLCTTACYGSFLVPGIDGTIGLSATEPFYLGHQGVPVQVQVSNLGDTDGPGPINVVMQISDGLTVVDHSPAGWTCTGSTLQFTCVWDDPLPAGDSLPNLEMDIAVGTFEETKGQVRLCAHLDVDDDVNPNNNTSCHNVQTIAPTADYDLAITKELFRTPGPDGFVSYNIDVENLGPDDVNDPIVMEDFLPPGLTMSGWSANLWPQSYQNLGTGYTATLSHLAAGDTFSLRLVATAAPDLEGMVENCAIVTAPQDLDPSNDEACFSFEVGAPEPFDLEVIGEVLDVPTPGNIGSYSYDLHNSGPNPTTETLDLLIDAPPPQSDLIYIYGVAGSLLNTTNTGLCTPVGASQLSCPLDLVIQPGQTRNIAMYFRMHTDALGTVPACLSIDPLGDTDVTNNEACLSADLPPPTGGTFGVAASLLQDGEARADAIGGLHLDVESMGVDPVPENAAVFVILPPSVRFVGATGSGAFSCTPQVQVEGANIVPCIHDGPMNPGAIEQIELAVWYEEAGELTLCSETSPAWADAAGEGRCTTVSVAP